MDDWKSEAKRLKFQCNKSWVDIATILRYNFPSKTEHQVIETIRSFIRKQPEYKKVNPDKPRIVGVVGDLHCPFNHNNYLQFLIDTFKEWKVTDVVFIGDIVDLHAISRHQTEPSAKGAEREYQLALYELSKYVKAFPKAKVTYGNHDDIPKRQIATLGMPESFLKTFKDLWNLPNGWEVDNHFIIDDVLYHHGLGSCGINGAINKALNERMSVVQGHEHSSFKIDYRANQKDIIFGLSCGCGVDNSAYAFNYGKFASKKPVLGTAIIKSSSEAYLVAMPERYFRTPGK